MDRSRDFRLAVVAALFLGAVSLPRLGLMVSYELNEDEAYYWDWSRHLAPAFYDQGPGVAFTIRAGTLLFGDTPLGVRFPALLIGIVTACLGFLLGKKVFGSALAGFFALLFIALTPINFLGGVLMMHDSVMYLCWVLLIWHFSRYLETESVIHLYVAGLWLGLGMLCKHTMVLAVPILFAFVLLSKPHRRLLRSLHFYLPGVVALAVVSPMLYWNLMHDFAGVKAILFLPSASAAGRAAHETFFEYVFLQFILLNPLVFLWMAIISVRELRSTGVPTVRRFLALSTVIVFLFFLLLSLRKTVQPNWAVFSYFGAMVLAGGSAASLWERRKFLRPVLVQAISVALISLAFLPGILVPLATALGIRMRPDDIPTNRLTGGAELAEVVDAYREAHPEAHVASNVYQIASLLGFYLEDQPQTFSLNIASRPNQYDFWWDPEKYVGDDFLFVYRGAGPPPEVVLDRFSSFEVLPSRTIERNGQVVKVMGMAVLRGFEGKPD